MAKSKAEKKVSTTVRLDAHLKSQAKPYLLLREMTMSEFVSEALVQYMERHPLTAAESEFWKYKLECRKKKGNVQGG